LNSIVTFESIFGRFEVLIFMLAFEEERAYCFAPVGQSVCLVGLSVCNLFVSDQ